MSHKILIEIEELGALLLADAHRRKIIIHRALPLIGVFNIRKCIIFILLVLAVSCSIFAIDLKGVGLLSSSFPYLVGSTAKCRRSAAEGFWRRNITNRPAPKIQLPASLNLSSLPGYPPFRPKTEETLSVSNNNNETKVILLWTALFGRVDWQLGSLGRDPFVKLNCPISNCLVTNDRAFVKNASTVLVSFRDDFDYSDLPSLQDRSPNQLWTFVIWESPEHTYHWNWRENSDHYRNLVDFSNFFNWTMTYRLDSDIMFNYGRFVPRERPDFSSSGLDRLVGKSRTAVWMNSHCDTSSHREDLVAKLTEYIDVDTIGGCDGSLDGLTSGICFRASHHSGSSNECLDYLSKTYKFYLAFENSLCRDYVTEKLYRAAKLDLIPIVLNGADMSKFAPPHSYIDAQQFSSAAELAAFLEMVGSDAEWYNSYFWWKPYYNVEHMWDQASFTKHFCDLCAKVTSDEMKPKSYGDIDGWWTTDAKCYEGRCY